MSALEQTELYKSKPESKYLQTGDFKTHYVEMGSGGTPIILIHGGGAGADGWSNWHSCLPLFAKHRRTIAIDLVGFGLSDKPDTIYNQDLRDRQLADFAKALNVGKVDLVGNSTGGLTSLGAALMEPEVVNKVVMMGSAGIETGVIGPLKALTEYDFTEKGMRRIISSLANPDHPVEDDLVTYRHQMSIDPGVRKGYTAFMDWIQEEKGLHRPDDFLAQLKHPTFVIHGKMDQVVPIESAYRLLDLIKNSYGSIMPHCGHWAMIEYPEIFIKLTMGFLNETGLKIK